MRRRVLVVLALVLGLVALAAPAQASGDDYPYRGDTVNRTDRWGFTTRQCVSFAAWRLEQRHHTIHNTNNAWGNADHWDDAARARGITVSRTARVGAIAQWNANERSTWYPAAGGSGTISAGGFGHVAYVRAVYATARSSSSSTT